MQDAGAVTTRRSVGARRLLASLLGAFAVYVALVGLMPDALPRRELYADLAYLPFSIITGVLFWQAARTGTDRCRQRGLHLLVTAQLFGTVNQAVWVLGSAGLLTDDSPVFMIAGLAMTVSTAAGMLYLVPGRGVAGTTPVVPVIDATLLALASFSVGWQWVGAPVLLSGTESGGGFLWLASVAGGDLFTALIALTAWAFTGQRLRSSAAAFLALGLGLTALLDILLEYQTLRGTYQSGGAVDVAFAASIVLLGVAAFIEQAPGEESTERSVRRAMLMRVMLPLVSAVAILLPVIAQVIAPTPGWARFVPVVLLGVFFFFVQWRARVLERAAEQALITRLAIERDLRLSQQFESLGRYAASVAHDMSNLLAALLAQTHVLRLVAGPTPGVGDRLTEMEKTLGSGATLSRRLMQMSRGDAAALEPIDLARAARNLALTVRRLLPDNVHLALECDRDPVVVALRPGDADQILLNLVVNARDALPEGGRISVRVGAEQERAVLVVEDDGQGIPPQVMHRIFEPFFTTRSDRGGTGLGLATVKDIADKSGGRLDVTSEPGNGARFTVSWPLASA